MRTIVMSIIAGLFTVGLFSNVASSMENTPDTIVLSYFHACENGDIDAMKSLIAGEFYQRRKTLIEKNKEYPSFLKHHYSGVQFRIISTVVENENGIAEVSVEQIFPDDNSIDSTLLLKRNANGNWKIEDEVLAK